MRFEKWPLIVGSDEMRTYYKLNIVTQILSRYKFRPNYIRKGSKLTALTFQVCRRPRWRTGPVGRYPGDPGTFVKNHLILVLMKILARARAT